MAGNSLFARLYNLVKLPHTLFALPFALVGVVYASWSFPVLLSDLLLVILAFTAARFAAMAFNRLVDADLDSRNPRTSGREIPTGAISRVQAGAATLASGAVFVAAAAGLNRLTFVLSFPALAWILAYSFTKRFTHWSHLWLGLSLGIAPVGGYLAIAGTWSTPWWHLLLLPTAVMLWVAGFDIFYALQDEAFDREHGLRSAVVLLGARGSIAVAKSFHIMMLSVLLLFGVITRFAELYYLGLVVAAGILIWEHRLVRPGDLSGLNAAFFTSNGVISIVVFAGALSDRLL